MLSALTVNNFALIEDIELNLDNGLTIITGETGAGKSILLGALSLLLGKRADLDSIKDPQKKCIIEGVFSVVSYGLEPLFAANDLDYDPQTIIRREILPSGKSRAFVNDTPVKLRQLSILGGHLVDIHSQHENLFVGDSDFQYRVIDTLAGNAGLLNEFREVRRHFNQLIRQLDELNAKQAEAQKTYDYNRFLLNELSEAKLESGMQEELEERSGQLSNVEELKENLSTSLQHLQQEQFGIVDGLQELKNRLSGMGKFGKTYADISERMTSVSLEVEDIAGELERLLDTIDNDPQTLETVNGKLQTIYALEKKHNAAGIGELLEIQTDLEARIAVSDNADKENETLKEEIKTAESKALKIADGLLRQRKKHTPDFTKAVTGILKDLGMPDARLKIGFADDEKFNSHGKDVMDWQFSANKGARFQAIKKSASGGELSRISLAIKSILAGVSDLPTIVFDEIDTGVSGTIAQKMGDIMGRMGRRMQVISITHLPQIAAKGNQHFKVFKETSDNSTHTLITKLSSDARVAELAEMLGGKEKSDSAIAHAKALLE